MNADDRKIIRQCAQDIENNYVGPLVTDLSEPRSILEELRDSLEERKANIEQIDAIEEAIYNLEEAETYLVSALEELDNATATLGDL